MLNLNSTIDLDFQAFLHWWGRELSFLIPEKIRDIFSNKQGLIVVTATEANRFSISYQRDGHSEQLAILESDNPTPQQFQDLLAKDERFSKAKIVLRLTGKDAIQKELALPAAAKENIEQVISYELDRYTPFKADQVYFAVKQLSKQAKDAEQINILLILTTKEKLDELYSNISAMGIIPMVADYEGVTNDFELNKNTYNLLPDRLRAKIAKLPQIVHTSLFGLVFLLLTAVIVLPVWFEYQAVEAISAKVKKVEKEAKKIKELQLETTALVEETQQLIDEKKSTPSVLSMLGTLSSLMKDDTWLAYLQYADKQLQIQGESPAASTLIAVLEKSDVFNNAVFISPVTQDSVSKQEHFQIMVQPAITKSEESGK